MKQVMKLAIPMLWLAGISAVDAKPIALVLHGGAGVIERSTLSTEKEAAIRKDLEAALTAGYQKLKDGGTSLDAVTLSITMLEDSPHFNAGKGAVFNAAGSHELDAAIMDGFKGRAGAIAGVSTVRNPILLARAVMEQSPHVMLVGAGAEAFADGLDLKRVEPSYFDTQERLQQLEKMQRAEESGAAAAYAPVRYFGTVGAVALDQNGSLAAATSTGGMTNKRFGRVGDSPIIGAGTFADRRCGVSATGHGEFFIRSVVAHEICARARYTGRSVGKAAQEVVRELKAIGGEGGVIALDAKGRVTMPFNTPGMYRAAVDSNGKITIAIFGS
jgi:beta-aspartyl-peptidase (threonine type)